MSKKYKILQKIKNNPQDVDFNTIKRLLENNGYDCINTGGSHYVFRKDNSQSITIPYKRPIKIIYIKQVLKILELEND